MIELPTDLPADLVPLAWLLGVWEGTGVIDYEASGRSFSGEFAHRVSFSHDGGTALNYSASAWLLPDDGDTGEGAGRTPLLPEMGYWRLARPATESEPGPALLPPTAAPVARTVDDVESLRDADGAFEVEASIVRADGVCELYAGRIAGPRIDLATDAVVRAPGAKPYSAASRMYGLVDGHLLWAWDIAAMGGPLAAHASARLAKVE